MEIEVKSFKDLNTTELYQILKLRSVVFVVEQNCPYLDMDGHDLTCHHLLMYNQNELVGYCRLIDQGISYSEYIYIGRVVINPKYRGQGFGYTLMNAAIENIGSIYGNTAIKISAQLHLTSFYEQVGFEQTGESYLEDDIPHIAMIRKPII